MDHGWRHGIRRFTHPGGPLGLGLDTSVNALLLDQLQQRLGYCFRDRDLLLLALSHRSVGARNNERLEFLGDALVNFVVAEALFDRFPNVKEGVLSRLRATLVCRDGLAQLAHQFDIAPCLLLGSGERKGGGRQRESILADALEAIVGAMIKDSSTAEAATVVAQWFAPEVAVIDESAGLDAKTRLQELLQAKGYLVPTYALLDTCGEDHALVFTVRCDIGEMAPATQGTGSSRRKAEQAAATTMLEQLARD